MSAFKLCKKKAEEKQTRDLSCSRFCEGGLCKLKSSLTSQNIYLKDNFRELLLIKGKATRILSGLLRIHSFDCCPLISPHKGQIFL